MQLDKRIKTLVKELNEIENKFKKEFADLMRGVFKEFFEKFPQIEEIKWRQYTPSFNDGDPCEFTKHDFEVKFFEKAISFKPEFGCEEDQEELLWFNSPYSKHNFEWYSKHPSDYGDFVIKVYNSPENKTLEEAFEFLKLFSGVPDKIWETLGEGEVFLNRDDFRIEEYYDY